ncbi:MAG: RHS repeat protein, partial [Planctomycetes bacterium]|nr:RHS repeat protein [Planctomycetota bacterium]
MKLFDLKLPSLLFDLVLVPAGLMPGVLAVALLASVGVGQELVPPDCKERIKGPTTGGASFPDFPGPSGPARQRPGRPGPKGSKGPSGPLTHSNVTNDGQVECFVDGSLLGYTTQVYQKWPNPYSGSEPASGGPVVGKKKPGPIPDPWPPGAPVSRKPGNPCGALDPTTPPEYANNICSVGFIPANPTIPGSVDQFPCICEIELQKLATPQLTSYWQVFGHSAPDANGITTQYCGRQGEGYSFRVFHDAQGQRLPYFEVQSVDGMVYRYNESVEVDGLQHYLIDSITDPSDNQTHYEYVADRVVRIKYPSGIDECWNYSPSWIGTGVGQWSPATYSGVEVTYVDAVGTADLSSRTQRMLFYHYAGSRPFAGDQLYRVYQCQMPVLDPATELYSIPSDSNSKDRFVVSQFDYFPGSSYLREMSILVADADGSGGISSIAAETVPHVTASYTYVEVPLGSGVFRVSTETLPAAQEVTTFVYAADPVEPTRVDMVQRSFQSNGTTETMYFDDTGRVTQRVTTPMNNAVGRPRAYDGDAAGAVEPSSLTLNYTYAGCSSCSGKPTLIEELPSGRRSEFVYDSSNGLLLEERHPSPAGAGQVATTYEWESGSGLLPTDPGYTRGSFRLKKVTTPDGELTYTYVAVPRDNLRHGTKVHIAVAESPALTLASGQGPSVSDVTVYNVAVATPLSPALDRQVALVGQVLSRTDGDGLTTTFSFDDYGVLETMVQNPTGGNESVTTQFVANRWGQFTSITSNAGSSLAHSVTITYNRGGLPARSVAVVNGQTIESKWYYDCWGNLCVALQGNRNSANGAPDDFGTPGRSEVAREWIRNEWHYEEDRLIRSYADRRPLDRNADSDAVADSEEARYLRTDYSWAPRGWVEFVGAPNGSTVQYTRDGYGSLYKVSVSSGLASISDRVFVNSSLEPVRSIHGAGPGAQITLIGRNASGAISSISDPVVADPGNWYPSWYPTSPSIALREFDRDSMGRVVEERVRDSGSQALLAKMRVTYDEIGRPYRTEMFDVLNGANASQVQTILWQGASRQLQVTGPAGRSIVNTFDSLGRVIESADSLPGDPNRIKNEFVAKTDFVSKVTRKEWDELPGANAYREFVTQYSYDSLGRVLQVLDGPAGQPPLTQSFTYYSTGQTESHTDPVGKVQKFLPDALGRLVEHYLPGAAPIWNGAQYKDWIGSGNRSALVQTDGRGRTTQTFYDFAGRVQAIMEPGSQVEPTAASPSQALAKFFAYDEQSQVSSIYAGDGIQVQYYHDGMGRLIARSSPTPSLASAVSWLHGRDIVVRDALGRITYSGSLSGANGTGGAYVQESREYDGLGRATAEAFNFLATSNWVKIGSSYTGADPFRTGLSYENQLGANTGDLAMQFLPDAIGRMQEVSWQTVGSMRPVASYMHQGGATRRRVTSWGATTGQSFDTDYRYDSYGRMDRITQSFDAQATVEFTYDAASNLLKEIYDGHLTATTYTTRKGDRFAYDEHHRLSKAWLGSDQNHMNQASPEAATGGEPVGDFVKKLTYGLDAANNRSSLSTQMGLGGTPSTATYTTDNTAPESNRYVTAEGVGVLYDQRGNTAFDGNYYYVYDEQNRLSEVYILVETDMAQAGAQTMLATDPTTGSTSEVAAQGKFVVSNPDALKNARTSILARASANLAEFISRHDERAYAAQFKETLSPSAVQPEEQTQSSSSSSSPVFDVTQMQLVAFYLYDVHDRRVVRMVMGTWDTRFTAWDGWQEAQELTRSGAGLAVPEKQFLWGEQLDELVAYRTKTASGWNEYYVAEGGAHCPQRILNSSGAVVEAQEYDPYGKTTFFGASG